MSLPESKDRLQLTQEGALFRIELLSEGGPIESRVKFQVYRYGELVAEQAGMHCSLEYRADDCGTYVCHVESVDEGGRVERFVMPFVYISESLEVEYQKFLSAPAVDALQMPAFYSSSEPFSDFVLVSGMSSVELPLCEAHGFDSRVSVAPGTTLFSSRPPVSSEILHYSGYSILADRMVVGAAEASEVASVKSLRDTAGCFSMVELDGHDVSVSTDYFGTGQVYYLVRDGLAIVSNRYHLLLLALRDLRLPLSLRSEHVVSSLGAHSAWTFYTLGAESIWRGLRVLRVGSRLLIKDGRIELQDAGLRLLLGRSSQPFSESSYRALVSLAKTEIRGSVEVCLDSPRFDEYSIDLTGGLDSRIAFSAASTVAGASSAIKVYSAPKRSSDFYIALSLSRALGFEYDYERLATRAKQTSNAYVTRDDLRAYRTSFAMGRGLDPNLGAGVLESDSRKVVITGGGGEAVSRPTITRRMLGDIPNVDYSARFTVGSRDKIRAYLRSGSLVGVEAAGCLERVFSDAFDEIDLEMGDHERLESMYLMYRNRYHFSPHRDGGYGPLILAPNMSPAALEAFRIALPRTRRFDHAFRLVEELNPVAAAFVYDSPAYNNLRAQWISSGDGDEWSRGAGVLPAAKSAGNFDEEFKEYRAVNAEALSAADSLVSSNFLKSDFSESVTRSMVLLRQLLRSCDQTVERLLGRPLFLLLVHAYSSETSWSRARLASTHNKLEDIVAQLNVLAAPGQHVG